MYTSSDSCRRSRTAGNCCRKARGVGGGWGDRTESRSGRTATGSCRRERTADDCGG